MNSEIFEYKNSIELSVLKLSKLIKEAYRKFHKENNFEISHEEFTILDIINSNPGIIPINIARELCIQRSYVGKLLNKMLKSKYIIQEKAVKGKKFTIIQNYISDKGKEIHGKILSMIKQRYLEKYQDERNEHIKIVKKINELNKQIEVEWNIKF